MRPPAGADRATVERALDRLRPALAARGIALGAAREGDPDAVPYDAAERRLAAPMHPRRRDTFLAGRYAARRALGAAGLPTGAILYEGDGRRPAFPGGSAGSLTHSGGLAAAVAADVRRYRALGCDLELRPLPREAAHLVLAPEELRWLDRESDPDATEGRLLALFSAKEAAFKAYGALLAADAPTTLRAVTIRPVADGFRTAPGRAAAHPQLLVRSRAVGRGVFSWTAAAAV